MKNTIKMSLAAALAVSALSTTATAGNLEEMIKDVTVSGKMEVEFDYQKNSSDASGSQDTTRNAWDLDWDMTAKIPVNDNITAILGAQADTEVEVQDSEDQTGSAGTTQINDDSLTVTKMYFQYANAGATAMVGKQGIGAPWFDDERANGVKALYTAGPVTVAAAHFTGTNATAGGNVANYDLDNTDISAAAVIGSFGPVNAQLWYANLSGVHNTVVDADSYVIMADATFDIVNVAAKYGYADYNLENAGTAYNVLNDDAEMMQLVVSADLGMATPYAGYGATDSKQGGAGLDLTSDTDSAMDFGSEQLSIDDLDNAEAYIVGVTVPMGAAKFDLSYVGGDYSDYAAGDSTKATAYKCDFNELLIQADYKMSKNLNIGAHYSMAELETSDGTKTKTDMDAASVSIEYKF